MWVMAGRYQSAVQGRFAVLHVKKEGGGGQEGTGDWGRCGGDVTPPVSCRLSKRESTSREVHGGGAAPFADSKRITTFLRERSAECGWHAPIPLARATGVWLGEALLPQRTSKSFHPLFPTPPGLPTPQAGAFGCAPAPVSRLGTRGRGNTRLAVASSGGTRTLLGLAQRCTRNGNKRRFETEGGDTTGPRCCCSLNRRISSGVDPLSLGEE